MINELERFGRKWLGLTIPAFAWRETIEKISYNS
jgi:hypothetical protein